MLGADYTTPIAGAELAAAGVKFVCRYLSTPGNPKNVTRGEAADVRRHGVAVVLVFETTARRMLAGRAAGLADGRSADAQAVAVNLAGAPVYFAADFDATPRDQVAINEYLLGASGALGRSRVGVYGGFYVVKRALDAGVCTYGWQTFAWSGGQWDPRAHIRQVKNGVRLAGREIDWDNAMAADFGQTPRPAPAPAPKPVPKPVPHPFPHPPPAPPPPSSSAFWRWARWRDAGADPATRPPVPVRVPLSWVYRYWLHKGAPAPLPRALRGYLARKLGGAG